MDCAAMVSSPVRCAAGLNEQVDQGSRRAGRVLCAAFGGRGARGVCGLRFLDARVAAGVGAREKVLVRGNACGFAAVSGGGAI